MQTKVQSSKASRFAFNLLWHFLSHFSPDLNRKWLMWELKEGAYEQVHIKNPVLKQDLLGKEFHSPFGLFLPFKGAENSIDAFIEMGFCFGEFGPYTLMEQKLPVKMKFLKKKKGVMLLSNGYVNSGLPSMVSFFLKRRRFPILTGINLISSINTEPETINTPTNLSAREELQAMVQKIAPYCDYIVINAAHPSSELYEIIGNHDAMFSLITSLKKTVDFITPLSPSKLLLEIPFDLTPAQMLSVGEIIRESLIDGVIVAGPRIIPHTDNSFNNVSSHPVSFYGTAEHKKILTMVKEMYHLTHGKKLIIAAGGVENAQNAFDMLTAGASLIRIDTAVFFNGPKWIVDMNNELASIIFKQGFGSIREIIGISANSTG